MRGADDLSAMKLFTMCENALLDLGYRVHTTTQFDRISYRLNEMGKTSITPMHSNEFNDLSKEEAFWLFLRAEGEDQACVAARVDNLHSEGLAKFWQRSYKRLYGEDGISRSHPPAVDHEIAGRVVYAGELFVRPEARGSRDLLKAYMHLYFSYCFMKWRPDWIYGFVRKADVERGLASVYGFTRIIPITQIWTAPPDGRSNTEYLVAISSDDFVHIARNYILKPEGFPVSTSSGRVEKFKT